MAKISKKHLRKELRKVLRKQKNNYSKLFYIK